MRGSTNVPIDLLFLAPGSIAVEFSIYFLRIDYSLALCIIMGNDIAGTENSLSFSERSKCSTSGL